MPLTALKPIAKKEQKGYKIARKLETPKIILAHEARFTLPTAFLTEQGFWKIRLAKDGDGDWRRICNYEMPDLYKEILQELWDYWDGKRKFGLYDSFHPATKDTKKYTSWPRYIPKMSGMKDVPTISGKKTERERITITNILYWHVDGEEEEEEEEPAPIFMKKMKQMLSKTTDDDDAPAKKFRCLCNQKH